MKESVPVKAGIVIKRRVVKRGRGVEFEALLQGRNDVINLVLWILQV